jgi:ATP-dependent Lhr-like helicase
MEGAPEIVTLAAADPAQPYGASLPWPRDSESERLPLARVPGAYLITADGAPALYVERGGRGLVTLPAMEDEETASLVLGALPRLIGPSGPLKELRLERVNRAPPAESALADALRSLGFRPSYRSWLLRP